VGRIFPFPCLGLFCLLFFPFFFGEFEVNFYLYLQNWFAARLTKWRKEEGFVPIAERAAILAQNMNKTVKS